MATRSVPVVIESAQTPAEIPSEAWELPLVQELPERLDSVRVRMDEVAQRLKAQKSELRYFAFLVLRATQDLIAGMNRGAFLDGPWFERWDVAFQHLYLGAMASRERGEKLGTPWQFAFDLSKDGVITPMQHLLLDLCVHLNYDLPRSLLQVISDEDFQNPELMARRHADFDKVNEILISRVPEEDRLLQLEEEPGDRNLLTRLLTPLNRLGTQRFIVEVRTKVWRNTLLLGEARRKSPSALKERLRQLDALSRAKMIELMRPGQVVLRVGIYGFGVRLPEG